MRLLRIATVLVILVLVAIVLVAVWRRASSSDASDPSGTANSATARGALPTAAPRPSPFAIADSVVNADGVPGTTGTEGCGDGLWQRVYNPRRLLVKQDCVTVTGTVVDATAPLKHQRRDGVRKEDDGDTHGWLRVDPEYANLINDGNRSDEDGNLVFEFVCHWKPTQTNAKSVCAGFKDDVTLPPVGAHVAITGTLVLDTNHGRWHEIHPVSRLEVR